LQPLVETCIINVVNPSLAHQRLMRQSDRVSFDGVGIVRELAVIWLKEATLIFE
jgi:hypothetical protein